MKGHPPRGTDDAVSPVIATILLAAIAVVVAAPVYVWTSGLRGDPDAGAGRAVTLSSNTPLLSDVKEFSVASATPGMRWGDFAYSLDGIALRYDGELGEDGEFCVASPGMACVAGTSIPDLPLGAGELIRIQHSELSGKTLRVGDPRANAVVLTLVVQ